MNCTLTLGNSKTYGKSHRLHHFRKSQSLREIPWAPAPWLCTWEFYLALHDLPVPSSAAVHPASIPAKISMRGIATAVHPNRPAHIDAGGSGAAGVSEDVLFCRQQNEDRSPLSPSAVRSLPPAPSSLGYRLGLLRHDPLLEPRRFEKNLCSSSTI